MCTSTIQSLTLAGVIIFWPINLMFCSKVCFFEGIRIWNKYIFIVFHYRFNITHSNLGDEITLQSHVTETVNNNGIFKSKMLQMKIVSYSMRSPSSRSYASCFSINFTFKVFTQFVLNENHCRMEVI